MLWLGQTHLKVASKATWYSLGRVCLLNVCFAAGLEVIPDLEVPCPSDDPAVPDVLPPSPQPPGLSSQRSPEGTTVLLLIRLCT